MFIHKTIFTAQQEDIKAIALACCDVTETWPAVGAIISGGKRGAESKIADGIGRYQVSPSPARLGKTLADWAARLAMLAPSNRYQFLSSGGAHFAGSCGRAGTAISGRLVYKHLYWGRALGGFVPAGAFSPSTGIGDRK